jgi:amino acid adenylation domain-containing protein
VTASRAVGEQVFRRKISPLEWWFLGHPGDLNPTFGVVVEGGGSLDTGRLAEAIATASAACPGARLVRRGQEWVDGGTPPPLKVVDVPADADLLKLPELRDCVAEPFCEVVLVRREAGSRLAVAFRAHHAVMDAQGLLTWARDIFHALRGEPVVGAPDAISDRDVCAQLPGRAESAAPQPDKPPIMGSCKPVAQARTVLARRSLQGRYPGITARLAALLAEVVAEQPGGAREAAFYVPVDLRYYRPEVRSTANLSLGMPVRVSAGEDWADVHARLLRAVKEGAPAQNVVPDVTLTAPLRAIESILRETNRRTRAAERFPVNAVLSHAGRVDLGDLCAPGFTAHTAFIMERPLPGEAPALNVLELDWHTEITVAWWDGDVTQARLDALLERLVARLATHATPLPQAGRPATGPEPADVVSRFLQRVTETPDAPALDGGAEGVLTYRQLERRTAALRARGAGPETVVGVLGDRSAAATIAVWGVLRAGAAYLPIDARNPDARIAGLLADAQAPICLVQHPYDVRDCLPPGCVRLVVDEDLAAAADLSAPEIRDDQLAFLIYTSGSTGRPKGVEIPHGALRAWTDWAIRDLGFDADTRVPMLASLGFDVAACALYLPLLAGGTAVLRPAEISHAMLRELLLDSGANTLMMTPSHLALINRLGLRPKGFRAVVLMGEPLSTAVAREAQHVFGEDCAIVNSYGPTETTVIMTLHPFDADGGATEAAVVPLGLPTTGTSVFVLDEHGRFAADGETGEIWIGGPQLARGYRGQPELTRRAFVRLADGTRVYRSGDLARRTPGGPLEFVSRVDDQVKILGHRVEPAETAHVLRGHPAVAEVVVLARPSGEHKALAAYVVRAPGTDVSAAELAAHASAALPAYLVPAATVFVEAIPHTINGKVDARRLPDPFAHVPVPAVSAAGRDALTAAIAGVWSEILGIDPDRLDDDTDFQQLGGNSLKLLTMLATVAGRVVDVPARAGFDAALPELVRSSTLRSVAAAVHDAVYGVK